MRRIRSDNSSFLKSLLNALKQCSINLFISIESWFLWCPWIVRQLEQIKPRSLQFESMHTKVGFWPCEWQLYGFMKSLKHFVNCWTSLSTDINKIQYLHFTSYKNKKYNKYQWPFKGKFIGPSLQAHGILTRFSLWRYDCCRGKHVVACFLGVAFWICVELGLIDQLVYYLWL